MSRLSETILNRLEERHDTPQITVLRRGSAALDLSGAHLHAAAKSLGVSWQHRLGPGSHTLVLALPAGERFLTALLAGLLSGHTIVPVALPRGGSQSERLRHIVRDCGASVVFCEETSRDLIARHLVDGGTSEPSCQVVSLENDTAVPVTRFQQDEGPRPAVIQYTSGSTRLPKGVRIFGDQILANCDLVARCWDMNPATRFVNWLPHFHDMGLMGGILYPLLTGAYSVQMSPLEMVRRPATWLRAISDHRATFSGGPAFAFSDCLRRITEEECEGLDLSTWRRGFCGAEPVPADLLAQFRDRFQPYGLDPKAVFACYGLAEMTLYAAGGPEPEGDLPAHPSGCSSVHPCALPQETRANLRIVDPETGDLVADGRQGEIWLKGPSKGGGYQSLPDETASTFAATLPGDDEPGHWLRTGDLGVVENGLLYVNGRLKDTLIVNGRKIAAAELEWLAGGIDASLNPLAAAAFSPDQSDSGVAALLIELKPGYEGPSDPGAVRAAIERAVLGEWGIRLEDVQILPRRSLERTSSGKIRRQAAAEFYRQEVGLRSRHQRGSE